LTPGYALDGTYQISGKAGTINRVPIKPVNAGYGAGGYGGVDEYVGYSANGQSTGSQYTLPSFTPVGAQGIALMRIQLGQSE
jgi:hypothetical protein